MTSLHKVKEMKVYISSCWWRDNDPFVRIVGNDAETVRKAAFTAMRESAKDAEQGDSDSDKTVDDYLNDIAWSGVSSMNLKDVLADYEIPQLGSDYDNLISGDKEAIIYLD